jgi:hypothetical protein
MKKAGKTQYEIRVPAVRHEALRLHHRHARKAKHLHRRSVPALATVLARLDRWLRYKTW